MIEPNGRTSAMEVMLTLTKVYFNLYSDGSALLTHELSIIENIYRKNGQLLVK